MIGPGALCAAALLLADAARAAKVEVINAESYFPDGPLWHEGQLYYAESAADRVMTWDGKENREVWHQDGCGPSAVIEAGAGSLLITCHDADALVRITADGRTLKTLRDVDGLPFLSPSDAVADAADGFYISASRAWDVAPPIEGKILYLAPDGTIGEVASEVHDADGLALSPDGRALYVSERAAQRVLKFEVKDGGTLGEREVFARLPDLAANPEGVDIYAGPGGLITDHLGNLYIAHFEGRRVLVVDPRGNLIDLVAIPARYVTNLTFGASEDVIFVTAATDAWTAPYPGQVYRIEQR
jgi:gluconolactonase